MIIEFVLDRGMKLFGVVYYGTVSIGEYPHPNIIKILVVCGPLFGA